MREFKSHDPLADVDLCFMKIDSMLQEIMESDRDMHNLLTKDIEELQERVKKLESKT